MANRISRRAFIRIGVSALGGSVLAACTGTTPSTPEVTEPEATAEPVATEVEAAPTAAVVAESKESSMLAELVEAGQLPPLEERLPLNPKVADDFLPQHLTVEVGRHGGTLRLLGPSKQYSHDSFIGCYWQGILSPPSCEGDPITSNICEYEASDDAKTFTFRILEGLKWSDGVPVTTRDVQFTLEDIYGNEELSPAGFPAFMRSGNKPDGEPMKVEIVDDTTFTVSFTEPYGGFPVMMAITGWRCYDVIITPRHYLEQFHKAYADPDELDALVKASNFETWVQLFNFKNAVSSRSMREEAVGMPKLYPWVVTQASDEGCIMERNPFYWKVDEAGNQLPYIDRVDYRTVEDAEVLKLKLLAGDADHCRQDVTIAQVGLLKENEEAGGFKLFIARMHVVQAVVMFNMTYADENWRQVNDLRFRQALGMAVNREEFIDGVWYGLADLPTDQDSTYDPQGAMDLLDEIGLDQKDADGFRLGPDGKTLTILFEFMSDQIDLPAAAQLITEFWNAVGIKTTAKGISSDLYWQRNSANELQVSVMWDMSPIWYYQTLADNVWAPLWELWWRTSGAEGEEPPEEYKTYREQFDGVLTHPTAEARETFFDCYKMIADNYWNILTAKNQRQPVIVNAKMGNQVTTEDAYAFASTAGLEMAFYEE